MNLKKLRLRAVGVSLSLVALFTSGIYLTSVRASTIPGKSTRAERVGPGDK